MTREEMSRRFLGFAAKIIELGKKLGNNFESRHVYAQLFRSGTSSGANYEESHSGESAKDFIHKREVCLKELRESLYWLQLIEKSNFLSKKDSILMFLLKENQELIKIIAKAITTTKSSSGKNI